MREPKNLCQKYIQDINTPLYTCPENKRTQITEIWIANTSENRQRTVTIYINGNEPENILMTDISLEPRETFVMSDIKIVLASDKSLFLSQKSGSNDVIISAFGIEEDA